MKSLSILLGIASEPLSRAEPNLDWTSDLGVSPFLLTELLSVLRSKNGFFAFESALLVLPSSSEGRIKGLHEWNERDGWIRYYDRIGAPVLFFGEDAFAGQYGITDTDVVGMNAETGEVTLYGGSLNDWAEAVLRDSELETGWRLAHEWQLQNGPLTPGDRLLPKTPFVMGGIYIRDNLVAIDNSEAMQKLGSLYCQIRDLPDGQQTSIKGWL